MARRKKRVEYDSHDRWLISYADFITLLFAFFVVMYSISSVNEAKYKEVSDSLSDAFDGKPKPEIQPTHSQDQVRDTLADSATVHLGEQQRTIRERMKNIAGGLGQIMAPMINRGEMSIVQSRRGIVIDISAHALFGTGEAILQSGSIEALRQVGVVLAKEEYAIEVEGHTDDIPIATVQFPSNWELSSARASSVVKLLVDNGVAAKRLAAVGLASNQPVAPNDSSENRARNRRVTITVMSPNAKRELAAGDDL